MCPIAAVCTVLLTQSRDPCHVPFPNFFSGHVSLPGLAWEQACQIRSLNLQPFRSYQHLTLKNLCGHVTLTTPTFRKDLSGVMLGLYMETPAKFEVRIFSRFGTIGIQYPKYMRSRDRDHAHILVTFVRGHLGTIPGDTPAKFEVRIFSRFGAISI